MKQTHKIAYDYAEAMLKQRMAEEQVNKAFSALGYDNQVFSLAEPIEGPYTKLVEELLGGVLFEWLCWWIYETEHGTLDMGFYINDVAYDPRNLTLQQFLEIVDAT